jgi:hypothetical protein
MEMDDSEVVLTCLCASGGTVWLFRHALHVLRVTPLAGARLERIPSLFLQPICLAALKE